MARSSEVSRELADVARRRDVFLATLPPAPWPPPDWSDPYAAYLAMVGQKEAVREWFAAEAGSPAAGRELDLAVREWEQRDAPVASTVPTRDRSYQVWRKERRRLREAGIDPDHALPLPHGYIEAIR